MTKDNWDNLSEDEFKALMRSVVRGMPDASDEELDAAMIKASNEMIQIKVCIIWYCGVMNDQMQVLASNLEGEHHLTPIPKVWPPKKKGFFEPLRTYWLCE
jgi:hypothetical protein